MRRPATSVRLLIAVAATALLAFPAAAAAGTATLNVSGSVAYNAAAGETNLVTVTREGSATYRIIDIGAPVTAGGGCVTAGANAATCSGFVREVTVSLGNLNDEGTVGASIISIEDVGIEGGPGLDKLTMLGGPVGVTTLSGDGPGSGAPTDNDMLFGGPFFERLTGGQGDDQIVAGPGDDDFVDGPGADLMIGGPGDDSFDGGTNADGADTLIGGRGSDEASYRNRFLPVNLIQNGIADDGSAGEGDNIADDIERLDGGSDSDSLVAGSADNVINGGAGNDRIDGGLGDDIALDGDDGNDVISGGPGDELFIDGGSRGSDELSGGPGDDLLFGVANAEAGLEADQLSGGPGLDTVSYATVRPALTIRLDDLANDGAAGGSDNVGSDIEDVIAGRGDDSVIGSSAANQLVGGSGDDALAGGGGADGLLGGRGRDRLAGGTGRDLLSGEANPDTIQSRGGGADEVLCGGAIDTVRADRSDRAHADCERVLFPRRAKAEGE
jgi:Ca2+-binding RTX toxin-like protein